MWRELIDWEEWVGKGICRKCVRALGFSFISRLLRAIDTIITVYIGSASGTSLTLHASTYH